MTTGVCSEQPSRRHSHPGTPPPAPPAHAHPHRQVHPAAGQQLHPQVLQQSGAFVYRTDGGVDLFYELVGAEFVEERRAEYERIQSGADAELSVLQQRDSGLKNVFGGMAASLVSVREENAREKRRMEMLTLDTNERKIKASYYLRKQRQLKIW